MNQPHHSAHVPVWVVGNVVVGGGGKSPLVMWLANWQGNTLSVCCLDEGYLGQYQDIHAVKGHDDVRLVGDEALCLSKALPDMPIVLAKDRRRGLSFIKNNYPDIDVILADDGLQNRHLPKDIVWVCCDATEDVAMAIVFQLGNKILIIIVCLHMLNLFISMLKMINVAMI